MAYTLTNDNFKNLQKTFKEETGIDAKDNMTLYVSYYQSKMLDTQTQLIHFILSEIMNKK